MYNQDVATCRVGRDREEAVRQADHWKEAFHVGQDREEAVIQVGHWKEAFLVVREEVAFRVDRDTEEAVIQVDQDRETFPATHYGEQNLPIHEAMDKRC